MIVLWLLFSLVLMSLVEYVVHRWPMHSRWWVERFGVGADALHSHATMHHGRFYRTFDHEEDPAARHVSIGLDPGFLLLGLSPLWVPLLFFSLTGGVVLACVIGLHGVVWTAAHREMHEPAGRWFCTLLPYRFLRAWHRRHHERPCTNYNAVLPFWDFVLGTYGGLSW